MKKITKIFTSLALASVLTSGLYAQNEQNQNMQKQNKINKQYCEGKNYSKEFKKHNKYNKQNDKNYKKQSIYSELNLTKEQEEKIKEIRLEQRKATEEKIYNILDADQKKSIDERRKIMAEKMQEKAKMLEERAKELNKK